MQERFQQLLTNIREWWDKFTTKQKTLIISVAAGVIVALAVLEIGRASCRERV